MHIKTSTGWKKLPQGFIKTSTGWKKLTQGFIKTTSGWKKLIFGANVSPLTVPTLTMSGSSTNFYGDGTLTLTRGDWDGAPILYYLKIQRSTNTTSGWTDVATVTLNDTSLPTSNTTYSVTDLDAKTAYYFRGYVKADNGTSFYEYTTSPVLSRISFTASMGNVTNVTANGATFNWSTAGLIDSTYIYSQQLDIIRYSDGVTVYTTSSIAGATSAIISNASIVSGVTHYAKITIIANDGWKTSGTPTQQISTSSNFIPFSSPVISVNPVLSPLNNRSYVPMSTTSSTNLGTWTSTDGTTIYRYQWLYYSGDAIQYQGYSPIAGATSASYLVPSNYTSVYGSTIRSRVTAANQIPSLSTIAATGNGSYATITTNIPHNLSAGNIIIISGMTPSGYNGLYSINSVTSNTITYANTTTAAQTVAGTIYLATHAYSSAYNVEAGVTVASLTVSPNPVGINTNTTFTAQIGGYPTSYIINWGDGTTTNSGAITSGTTSVGLGQAHSYTTAGTKTIGVTAQPGNVYNSINVSVANPVAVSSYPAITGSGAVGTNIAFSGGSYTNASSVTTSLVVSLSTSFSTSSGIKTNTSPYTVTSGDTAGSPYYFAVRDTVVGLDGVTYYFWSGGYSGASVNIPAGSGSILSYNPTVAPYNGTASVSPTSGTAGSTTFTASTSGWIANPAVSSYTYSWQYLNAFGWNTYQNSTTFVAPVNYGAYAWQLMVTAYNGIAPDGKAYASFSVSEPVVSCTCVYSDAGTYYSALQCCASGSARTGFPTVYNSGNSVCTTCYSGNTVNSCCPNVAKIYTKCSANDVTNSSSPVYFYCYSTGQCINSTQGAGGSC